MDQISFSQQSQIGIASSYQVQQNGKSVSSVKGDEKENSKSDKVTLSEEGKKLSEKNSNNGLKELTASQLQEVEKLKKRDAEVRAHEQAHMAAAGAHALGGPEFSTTKGPDGNSYATSGHVSVDISKEKDPVATLAKMRVVRQAALAPSNPSSADRQIAAKAAMMEQQARAEISKQENTEVELIKTPESSESNTQQIKEVSQNNTKDSSNGGEFTAQLKDQAAHQGFNKPISVFA